jgi:hypothetical protein
LEKGQFVKDIFGTAGIAFALRASFATSNQSKIPMGLVGSQRRVLGDIGMGEPVTRSHAHHLGGLTPILRRLNLALPGTQWLFVGIILGMFLFVLGRHVPIQKMDGFGKFRTMLDRPQHLFHRTTAFWTGGSLRTTRALRPLYTSRLFDSLWCRLVKDA